MQQNWVNGYLTTELKLFYYFQLLDLDGKVDFLDSLNVNYQAKNDKRAKILNKDKVKFFDLMGSKVTEFRSEIEHHLYYHLNEEDSEEEEDK